MAKQKTTPKQPKQPKEAKKQVTKEVKTEQQQDNPHVIKHHNVLKSYS